ncbi:hypothetical protein RFH42_05595 [Acinetobacter rudis]|uniref:hypothetical protein n=1 Tax=Acinetobacter rudis TaxID=632955 RepID=UPI00280EDBC7|nr:hypothetical protein [Acinetobacter rudis]MDQ8952436.1 hypothetical protein [Acinetobacter rudis]
MRKMVILSVFLYTHGVQAFDDECISTLRVNDAGGSLDKIIRLDSSKEWIYFHDDKGWTLRSPTNCKKPITNYEKIVCAEPSLVKLDVIAYATTLQNTINASGSLLSKKDLLGSNFNQKWVNRSVSDEESVCLKLVNIDQVNMKLKY